MANGKIIFPSGESTQVTYPFPKNYDYGHTVGYLSTSDNARTFDGTLNSYQGGLKKYFDLTFTYTTAAQFEYFMTLWRYGVALDLYLDGDDLTPDAVVYITEAPSGESEAVFVAGAFLYTFTVHMEEV